MMFAAILAAMSGILILSAEVPVEVSESFVRSRVVQMDEMVYPLAQPARVSGFVRARLSISRSGRVESVEILRGHPLLNKSAELFLLSWRLETLDIPSAKVTTQVHVFFDLTRRRGEKPAVVVLDDGSFVVEEGRSADAASCKQRWISRSRIGEWLQNEGMVSSGGPLRLAFVRKDEELVETTIRLLTEIGVEQIDLVR